MTSRSRLIVLLLSIPFVAFALVGGLLGSASAREGTFQHLRVFDDVMTLIRNNYVEEADGDKLLEGALRGLGEGLDADSGGLSAADAAALARKDVPAGETGIELTRQYYLRVVAVRDGSPAARAGLRTGDYVRAIDGKPTRDLSVQEGARALRGAPGSTVTLTIIRGSAAEPHEVVLDREVLPPTQVTSRALGDGVGYVRIATFGPDTAGAVRSAIAELQRGGAGQFVLDLRGTAQGEYQAAIDTARLFVANATLVKRERRGHDVETIAAGPRAEVTAPVVLLTTAGTSGPAEVFVSALHGNKRAQTVGERTLGRAGEQKLVPLPDGSALWLTHAQYLDAAGKAIAGNGILADTSVEEPDVEFGAAPPAGDPILDAALEKLKVKAAA
jgi:carboxyl-terminal processing protease